MSGSHVAPQPLAGLRRQVWIWCHATKTNIPITATGVHGRLPESLSSVPLEAVEKELLWAAESDWCITLGDRRSYQPNLKAPTKTQRESWVKLEIADEDGVELRRGE